MEALLVHLCGAREWEALRPADLILPDPHVGFVHLSAPSQVHLPANRLFARRTDMVLLYVDPTRLTAPLRWEPGVPTDPESMLFPHLYGALPVSAVVEVRAYQPDSDGRFAPLAPYCGGS